MWMDLVAGQFFRRLNTLSTDVVVYMRKEIDMLSRKKNYIDTKGKKNHNLSICKEFEKRKEERCFLEKKNVFCRG